MTLKWVRPGHTPDDDVELFSPDSIRAEGGDVHAEDDIGDTSGKGHKLIEGLAWGDAAAQVLSPCKEQR